MTYWTPCTDSQPPPDPPWVWRRYRDGGPHIARTGSGTLWTPGTMWAPITGPMPPAPGARAPEPEPEPLFKAGDVVVRLRSNKTDVVVGNAEWWDERFTPKPGWHYPTERHPNHSHEDWLRPATPGEEAAHRYPVGRRVRSTTNGEVGTVTGHSDAKYVLGVQLDGDDEDWWPIRDAAGELLWDLLPEAPERPGTFCADTEELMEALDNVAPPVDPGPWRPTSETPADGQRILVRHYTGQLYESWFYEGYPFAPEVAEWVPDCGATGWMPHCRAERGGTDG